MLDKNSNASRLVEKLRLKKLVERATCPEDRRAVNIVITKQGLSTLEKLDILEEQWLEDIKKLSEKEVEQLNYLLNKIRR
jgi:DNA-binding MarR family transcriptional regulator